MGVPVFARSSLPVFALVVVGDADVVRPEHAVDTFRLLQKAQLAVLPGTDYMQVTARVDWLVPMIDGFLDEDGRRVGL